MPLTFTDDNFESEVLKSDVPVLVDFWAPWCGPCKALGPTIEELHAEYEGKGVKIGKVNVDENQQTPSQYGIMSIPTMIFFKGGAPQGQMVGAQPKEKIKQKLDELIG